MTATPPIDRALRSGGATPPADSLELGYDPWDHGFIADPYPALGRLRDQAPVVYDERTNQWLVSRHADVNALLRDRRLGRSYLHVATHEEWGRTAATGRPGAVLGSPRRPDDRHGAARPHPAPAARDEGVHAADGRGAPAADRGHRRGSSSTHARGLGEFDLIADLLELVPVTVIAELLGIPESDRHLLRPWSADMTLMFELNPTPEMQRRATDASAAFGSPTCGTSPASGGASPATT